MTDREPTQVESHYNPIVLSDDEYDGEFDSESYTNLDLVMRCVLKVDIPDSDDEVIQEFDHTKG